MILEHQKDKPEISEALKKFMVGSIILVKKIINFSVTGNWKIEFLIAEILVLKKELKESDEGRDKNSDKKHRQN